MITFEDPLKAKCEELGRERKANGIATVLEAVIGGKGSVPVWAAYSDDLIASLTGEQWTWLAVLATSGWSSVLQKEPSQLTKQRVIEIIEERRKIRERLKLAGALGKALTK